MEECSEPRHDRGRTSGPRWGGASRSATRARVSPVDGRGRGLTWLPLDDDQPVLGQREVDGAVLLVHDEQFSRRVGFGLGPDGRIVARLRLLCGPPGRAFASEAACAAHSETRGRTRFARRAEDNAARSTRDSCTNFLRTEPRDARTRSSPPTCAAATRRAESSSRRRSSVVSFTPSFTAAAALCPSSPPERSTRWLPRRTNHSRASPRSPSRS